MDDEEIQPVKNATRYAFDGNADNGIRVDVHERRGRITMKGKPGNGSTPIEIKDPAQLFNLIDTLKVAAKELKWKVPKHAR